MQVSKLLRNRKFLISSTVKNFDEIHNMFNKTCILWTTDRMRALILDLLRSIHSIWINLFENHRKRS